MQLEPVLVAYAGLACWALSTQRLRRELKVHDRPPALLARLIAIILIALAAGLAVREFGPQQGAVAAIGFLSATGLLLLLLLSRWPKLAMRAGVAAFALAGAVSIIRVM